MTQCKPTRKAFFFSDWIFILKLYNNQNTFSVYKQEPLTHITLFFFHKLLMLFLLPHNPLLHLSALGLNRHSDEAEEGGKTQRI